MKYPSDGIEGIHGIGELDEPPLCPCGHGYVGHAQHAEVWCRLCPEPATGDDGLCDPHRAGVPATITDPWLAQQFQRTVKRRRIR